MASRCKESRRDGVAACRRFSASAATYHESVDVQRSVAESVLDALSRENAPARVLELGCGTGLLTAGLLATYRGVRILAIDAAPAMIEQARRRAGRTRRVEWRVQDAMELVTRQRFDFVVSSSALHWMMPLGQVFTSVRRVLAPGGKFIFGMMVAGTLVELRRARAHVSPGNELRTQLPEAPAVLRALRRSGCRVLSSETERILTAYPDAKTFLRRLHDQGVTGGAYSAGTRPLTAGELARLCTYYNAHFGAPGGGVRATYEILYVTAEGS
jgi:malonyl-CoA O-methyltransferase